MARFIKIIFYPSSLSLILVNLIPLFGVLFWSWDSFAIIFLYWSETVVVGFFNVLKIKEISKKPLSPFLVFFIVQYILFLFVYLFLIMHFFRASLNPVTEYLEAFRVSIEYLFSLFISFLLIFISHGLSFQHNFISKKEFLYTSELKQLLAPYKRLLIMHIIVVFGAFGTNFYGQDQTLSVAIYLIVIKTSLDLIFHVFEHRKNIIK